MIDRTYITIHKVVCFSIDKTDDPVSLLLIPFVFTSQETLLNTLYISATSCSHQTDWIYGCVTWPRSCDKRHV